MEIIKTTLTYLMRDLKAQQNQKKDGPESWLKNTLTKKELRHIKLNYLKRGILSVNVDSSSWLYSLGLRKQELLARIQKESSAIKDIRFRIGEVR